MTKFYCLRRPAQVQTAIQSKAKLSRAMMTAVALLGVLAAGETVTAKNGELRLRVVDEATGGPIAVRMHLKNQKGRQVVPKNTVSWKGHFVIPGVVTLELPPGRYQFEMERGPEYRIRTGNFEMKSGADDSTQVDMIRIADLKKEGWWSGDLHVHRPLEDIPLLMQAEDLHVAPVITWWNKNNPWNEKSPPEQLLKQFDENRYYHVMAGEDERGGGALLYFNREQPLPIAGAEREHPSSVKFLVDASRDDNIHIDIEKPFWWDMPLWIASRKVHSIGLAHNHMWRDGVLGNEAWGRPRPKRGYPNPHGNAQWTQYIYYQLLEAGIRLPPSAGSASGVLPNPVGYNRVYAHVEGEFTYEKWWESLRAGRVFVTNGPLIRASINGKYPGHVFTSDGPMSIQIALNLATREKIHYLEIVQNGKVKHEVLLSEVAKQRGKLPEVQFDESGWVLVRAVTNAPETYRFASTGPFYVEIGQEKRISREATEFFLKWIDERSAMIQLGDAKKQEDVMKYIRGAESFWKHQRNNATVD